MRPGVAVGVDADERLEPPVAAARPPGAAASEYGRRCSCPCAGDGDRLARRVVERVTVEDRGARCALRGVAGIDLADRGREHAGLCYLTVA
mgnify:CR=1 FL=1